MKHLLYGYDAEVADWTFKTYSMSPVHYDMAVGIMDGISIVGSVMWSSYRGHDIEISYYGPKTMTLGIARECARVAIDHFGVSRVSARTSRSNKTMTRGVKKIGFEYEGILHNAYGDHDAVMYGLYGRNLARLAGKEMH